MGRFVLTPTLPQFIESEYKHVVFKQHNLRIALKNGVASGKIFLFGAKYKLSDEEKKPAPKKKVSLDGSMFWSVCT